MPDIKKLVEYDDLYYNKGKSPLSDEEYDKLKEELKSQFPGDPYFSGVGSQVQNNGKVKLKYTLGSLNKVKIDKIEKWLADQKSDIFVISEKLDGVSFYVNYKNRKVVHAATRGDGSYGQDITDKAKVFCGDIKTKADSWFRCEAMLVGSQIHEQLGFKTRRNGVAGIINRDGLRNVEHITPYFYEYLNYDYNLKTKIEISDYNTGDELQYPHEFTRSNFIQENVVNTKNYSPIIFIYKKNHHTVSDIVTFYNQVKNMGEYDVDGLVITPMDYDREDVAYPKNKIAFKMNEKPVDVIVKEVLWSVTRTGRVMPLVSIEPTEIQGVTISKATGFNAKFIVDNHIGEGSVVKLIRSGDVIPYIVSVEKKGHTNIASKCPACESDLVWEGVDLKCTNDDCWRKSYKELEHFLRAMGAENITEKTLMKLGISHLEMMYEVDEWSISTIDGFGVKRAQQIVDEIQGTLFTTPEILLRAFGMKNIGRTLSKDIIKHLRRISNDDNQIMEYVFSLPYEELIKIDGIGEKTANVFISEINNHRGKYDFLKSVGLVFANENEVGNFDGMRFTLTGKGWLGRKEIQTLIEQQGGSVGGVNKTSNYLVVSDLKTNTSKAKKARQYGVDIILYEELKRMLGG